MRTFVVTGVSTGIGLGTAQVLIRNGAHVFGSVRRVEDAERLRAMFPSNFTPLQFDVTQPEAIAAAAQQVGTALQGQKLSGLVNNAGIALAGPLLHLPIKAFRDQLEVNVIGVVSVVQAFAPLLGTDRSRQGEPGRIINMSSVAGRFGLPFLSPYVASKHALEGLSECLRRELLLYGIDVILIGPGSIATPIWDKAEKMDIEPYRNTDYAGIMEKFRDYLLKRGRSGYPAERVGETVWTALTTPNPKTRYALVPKRLMNWTLPSLLPRRMVDRAIARQLGW